jgi:hypothetical protein
MHEPDGYAAANDEALAAAATSDGPLGPATDRLLTQRRRTSPSLAETNSRCPQSGAAATATFTGRSARVAEELSPL